MVVHCAPLVSVWVLRHRQFTIGRKFFIIPQVLFVLGFVLFLAGMASSHFGWYEISLSKPLTLVLLSRMRANTFVLEFV